MSWFLSIVILTFAFANFSQARNIKKLTSTVVFGTIYCDTCIQEDYSKASHFISGALVSLECGNGKSKLSFHEEVETNHKGEFSVRLPFSFAKHVKKVKNCSIKLLKSSEPFCVEPSSSTSSTLHLESRKQGTDIFSAGLFVFKPSNQPELCKQKPEKKFITASAQDISFPPPIQDPDVPFIPPIPDLPPIPTLPPLPQIPKIPILPPKTSELQENGESVRKEALGENRVSIFPPIIPNPLQPPPSLFPPIPNPFQPPPSIFPPIPNPLQPPSPPPSIFPPINFPPLIPGVIPSPPPPPPPVFPIPLPPVPFVPVPGFPGSPPTLKKASP